MMSSKYAQNGFVLPYVLAVLAVLSVLTVIGANALRQGNETVSSITQKVKLSQAIDDAEKVVIHIFLSSPFISKGMDLSGRTIDESELAFGEPLDEEGLLDEKIWFAVGGKRKYMAGDVSVEIVYQDADGLLSINSATDTLLAAWLEPMVSNRLIARSLAAKLIDFRDADSFRRFQGAERADYRLANRKVPTNSSFRSYSEIYNVLQFEEALSGNALDVSNMTLFLTSGSPRRAGMPEALRSALSRVLGTEAKGDDLTENQLTTSRFPSERAQFTLTAISPDTSFGLQRIIEVERTSAAPDKPFNRRKMAEIVLRDQARASEYTDENLPPIFSTPASPNR